MFINKDDTLTGDVSSVDIATKSNLEDLVKIGEELLKKPVSRVDIDTGLSKPIEEDVTNMEALKRYACTLPFFLFINYNYHDK